MKLLAVDEYIRFECIGGSCPISCCGGNWGIPIDDESYENYLQTEGEFGDILRNGITKVRGTYAFKLDEKTKDCIFLNRDKLCSIYRNLGPDALCETCRTYPRAFYHVGDIEFCYLVNSCPEVNRMIIQRIDAFDTLYDDSEEEKTIDFDKTKFGNAINALLTGLNLLENRLLSIGDRLILLLLFTKRFQEAVRAGNDPVDIITLFSEPELYVRLLDSDLVKQKNDITAKIHVFMIVYRTLMMDSYDHPMWKQCTELADSINNREIVDIDKLRNTFTEMNRNDIQLEQEQLICYRFFSVFMQGYKNEDFYDHVVYEILILCTLQTYIALTETVRSNGCSQEERILFYSICGRIDHTKRQKDLLISELRNEGFYELDKLIGLVR